MGMGIGSVRSRLGLVVTAVAAVIVIAWIASLLVGSSSSVAPQAGGTSTPATTPVAPTTTAPATSSTTPTAAPTVTPSTPTPQRTVTVPRKLPAGPDLGVAYYEGRTYSCPGTGDISFHPAVPSTPVTTHIYPGRGAGPRIPVRLGPIEKVTAFTKLGTRYLLAVTDCTSSDLRSYATDGTYKTLGKNSGEHPFSTGVGTVAVTVARHQVALFNATTAKKLQTWTLPNRYQIAGPYEVLPDGSVLVTGYIKGGQTDRLLLPDGSITKLPSLLKNASGVNPVNGNVVNWLSTDACKNNTAAFDAQTQEPLWVDCGYGRFYIGGEGISPDGKLIAVESKGKPALLDAATGDVLVKFAQGPCMRLCIPDVVWEDDTHVVFQNFSDKDPFLLFRYSLTGKVSTVSVAKPPANTGGFRWQLLWRQ
jgi:hypothetical protein